MERLKLHLASPAFQLQIQILEARTRAEDPNIDTLVQDFSNLLLEETKQVVQFRKGAPPHQAESIQEMVRSIPPIPQAGSPQTQSPSPPKPIIPTGTTNPGENQDVQTSLKTESHTLQADAARQTT